MHSCIRDRPLSDRSTTFTDHLDTVAYWRNAYIKSEETQVQLRARVTELEQGKEGSDGTILRTLAWTRSPRKRKRTTTDLVEASSQEGQKRARVRTTPTISSAQKVGRTGTRLEIATSENALQEVSVLTEEIEGSALRPCNHLIHNLYLLQQVVAHSDPDHKELTTALCGVSASICKLILATHSSKNVQIAGPSPVNESEIREHDRSAALPGPFEDVKATVLAIRRAFPSLLEGLHRLNSLPSSTQARGQVIWSLTKIFDVLLEQIDSLCTVHSPQLPKVAPRVSKSRTKTQVLVTATQETQSRPKTRTPCQACRSRHRKCDGRVPTCRNCENWRTQCKRDTHPDSGNATSSKSSPSITSPPESALRLCELAKTMMKCLDVAIPSHTEVLEGCLFLLLKRVGEALKVFVFEDGIIQDLQVDAIRSTAAKETATNHQAVQAQAPCLIYLLEEAKSITLTLNSQPHSTPIFTELPQQSRTLSSTLSTTNLSNHAQIRLQHTLLTAVFGDQTRSDFQATFIPPDTPIGESMTAKFSECTRGEGIRDWFKQEVWRIIGWDALRLAIQLGEEKR